MSGESAWRFMVTAAFGEAIADSLHTTNEALARAQAVARQAYQIAR